MTSKTSTTGSQSTNSSPKKNTIDDMKREVEFGLRPLSTYEERDVDWVWYPYLARGELTIIEGDPEAGKSIFVQAVCQHLIDGEALPSRQPQLQAKPGKVILFDCENEGSTVLRKRFRYLGLDDFDQVIIKEDPFVMGHDDIDDIIDACRSVKPLLVVFDTMNDYLMRKTNTGNGLDVTQALQPFKKLARELDCAVVLIRHLTKDSSKKALYRGNGSVSFVGKARIVIAVAQHPDDEEARLAAVSKLNLVRKPKAIEYKIIDRGNKDDIDKFRFKFTEGEVDYTADDILGAQREPGRPDDARQEAVEFLQNQLRGGPVEASVLRQRAEAHAINERTLRRAADTLNVVRTLGRNATWALK